MLPLFDFHKMSELIYVIDIDYYDKSPIFDENTGNSVYTAVNFISHLLSIIEEKKLDMVSMIYRRYDSVIRNPRLYLPYMLERYGFYVRLLCTFVSRVQFDKKVFADFLRCILDDCEVYKNWLKDFYNRTDCKDEDSKLYLKDQICSMFVKYKKSPKGFIIYGVDEMFLNHHMLVEIFDKRIKLGFSSARFPSYNRFATKLYTMYKDGQISRKFIDNFYYYVYDGKTSRSIIDNAKGMNRLLALGEEHNKRVYNFFNKALNDGTLYKNMNTKNVFDRKYFDVIKHADFYVFYGKKKYFYLTYNNKGEYKINSERGEKKIITQYV